MQLTILGSGSLVPSLKRSGPANFLKIKGKNILVDCGPGTMTQLLKAKIDYKNIDMVFLTHFHDDHIGEFNTLKQALKFTPGFKRTRELIVVGGPGIKEYYKKVLLRGSGKPKNFEIIIKEIGKNLKFDGFFVESQKTVHTPESVAFKFREGNKSVVITGDCAYNESLIDFAKEASILLIECSSAEKPRWPGHLAGSDCGNIAKKADVKKLILTHLMPTSPDGLKLKAAKKIFKNTVLAKDFMKISM